MQFFALILLNIAMFAIFYLLISLKLERKATEFREKKLRRLMEEMIAEFNETAERNITLLESRITTMKKLLQSPGGLKSLDVSVMGGEEGSIGHVPPPDEKSPARHADAVPKRRTRGHGSDQAVPGLAMAGEALVRGAGTLARKVRGLIAKATEPAAGDDIPAFPDGYATAESDRTGDLRENAEATGAQEILPQRSPGSLIRKDLSTLGAAVKQEPPAEQAAEEEIAGLFNGAGDKYALVGDLYGKGYSIELISRCSGIPQGEIRLVLNLGI
jgi:hypothetical protein